MKYSQLFPLPRPHGARAPGDLQQGRQTDHLVGRPSAGSARPSPRCIPGDRERFTWRLLTLTRELREYELELFEWELDNIETWLDAVREELEKQSGRLRVEERIALLRKTDGRTPEEAEAFRRKADQLEQNMEETRA